jgi:hypothetical protein
MTKFVTPPPKLKNCGKLAMCSQKPYTMRNAVTHATAPIGTTDAHVQQLSPNGSKFDRTLSIREEIRKTSTKTKEWFVL